jgi:hypothetical protein
MRAFNLTALAFGLALGFGASEARGQIHYQPEYSKAVPPIGGTCVPDSATIRAAHYETAGFGVRFGNGVGQIRLLCPLNTFYQHIVCTHSECLPTRDTFIGMAMSVNMDAGGRIRAHLRRAEHGTNIWIAIGVCDSNTSNTTFGRIICYFDHYQPTESEWYWWDVEIERTTPSVNVEFLGIEILTELTPP